MSTANPSVGYIGLGLMGRGMAQRLIEAGYPTTVWNRTAAKAAPFIAAGARASASPAELAAQSDIIFICVSDTPDVEAVVLGPGGVLEGVRPGSLVIDMSTISPQATREIAAKLREKGAALLDAPVSGGPEGAAKGTMSIMVGGAEEDFTRALPVLEHLGKSIIHVGPQGAGQMVKLVNQILVVVTGLAVSEAMLFAQAGGLDLEKTIEAVRGGAAGSWMLSMRGPQMIQRDWRPGFTIDLQQKDLRLALEAGDQIGVPLLATSIVFNMYRTLQSQGLGQEGNHALVKALEALAGFEISAP